MCFFVTIGVRSEGATELEASIPRGLALYSVANRSVLRQLPTGYRAYVLTSGMCSCDLYRKPVLLEKESEEAHAEQLRRRYAKRGWSAAKVARAVTQVTSRPEPEEPFTGLRADVRELLADVAEDVGELAIVVHWYNGDVETEKFNVAQGPCIPSAECREGSVTFVQDSAYQIRGQGRTSRST